MRLLTFSTLFPSSERPGHGIFVETRLRELLSSGQVESRVVAPVPWFFSTDPRWGSYARMARTPARETRNGIDVLHPRYLLLPKIGMTPAPLTLALGAAPALRQLRREGFDFDAIDAHYFYPDGVAAALLAKWFDRPLAITARGSDLNLIGRFKLPRAMMRWAADAAQASIGVSASLTDVLRGWDVPADRLHVLRNGVDLARFQPQPQAEARAALGLPAGVSPVLLSVGHLVELKGHRILVEALAQLRQTHSQAHLVIVGEGPERPAILERACALGVSQHVQLTGALPQQELPRWYSAADLLLLASSREGWANVLLEAMACGTAVVATDVGGSGEVVREAAAGLLVRERSAGAFVEAIVQRLAMGASREEVRRYAQGFGWQETTEAQCRLFARMTGRTIAPQERTNHA